MKVPEEMACNTPFAMSRPLLLPPVSVISVPMATPEYDENIVKVR